MNGHKGKSESLVIAHFVAAWVWLIVAMTAGMIMGAHLAGWRLFSGAELFSPGRLWTVHTNFMLWGFLCNIAMGLLYAYVPYATGRTVLSPSLSWFVCALLQFVVAAAGLAITVGYGEGFPWGEMPSFIVPMLLATLALAGINLGSAAIGSDRSWPLAMWCFLAAGIAVVLSLATVVTFPNQNHSLAFPLILFGVLPAAMGILAWIIPQKQIWPRRWLALGGIAAAILIVQCVMQMLLFPSPLELRPWIERNAYTILFCVLPLWMTAAMLSTVPKATRSEWKSQLLLQGHFWFTTFGLVLMLTDLLPVGLIPGGGHPSPSWSPLSSGTDLFWKVQMVAGAAVLAGQFFLIVNLVRTWRIAEAENV